MKMWQQYLTMAVVQAKYELLKDPSGLSLCKPAMGFRTQRVSKQVAPLSKLHADCQVLPCQENLYYAVTIV